jgi:hypothetical protein
MVSMFRVLFMPASESAIELTRRLLAAACRTDFPEQTPIAIFDHGSISVQDMSGKIRANLLFNEASTDARLRALLFPEASAFVIVATSEQDAHNLIDEVAEFRAPVVLCSVSIRGDKQLSLAVQNTRRPLHQCAATLSSAAYSFFEVDGGDARPFAQPVASATSPGYRPFLHMLLDLIESDAQSRTRSARRKKCLVM